MSGFASTLPSNWVMSTVTIISQRCTLPHRRGYVRAEPGQTLGDVRQTILHNYLDEDPARVMSDKFCHPRDGHIISDSSTVNDIGVRMRRLHEYMHVLTLVPHNQHALLKQSTLQMLPR